MLRYQQASRETCHLTKIWNALLAVPPEHRDPKRKIFIWNLESETSSPVSGTALHLSFAAKSNQIQKCHKDSGESIGPALIIAWHSLNSLHNTKNVFIPAGTRICCSTDVRHTKKIQYRDYYTRITGKDFSIAVEAGRNRGKVRRTSPTNTHIMVFQKSK